MGQSVAPPLPAGFLPYSSSASGQPQKESKSVAVEPLPPGFQAYGSQSQPVSQAESTNTSDNYIPPSDTGIVAGAIRGISNLNPLNLIPKQPPFAPTTPELAQQQSQQVLEHPFLTALSAIPIAGPMIASLAQRAPSDPLGAAAEAAVTLGAPAAIAKGFPATAEFMTRKVNAPRLNAIMKVSPEELMTGRNPGARVIGEKIIATSREDLLNKMEARKVDVGNQLESKLSTEGQNQLINGKQIVRDAFEQSKKLIGKGSDKAFMRRLEIVYKDIDNYANNEFGTSLEKLSPLQAQRLKSFIGKSINFGENVPYEAGINSTLSNIYRGFNDAIESKVPGTRAVLGQYGDFEVGTNALRREVAKGVAGQKLKGSTLGRTIAGRIMRPPTPPTFGETIAQQEQTPEVQQIRRVQPTAEEYLKKKLIGSGGDMVTVYRGETPPGGKSSVPPWINPEDNPGVKAGRRWFTDNLENAQWYQREAGEKGRIISVQIPRSVWEASKKSPETIKWSRRPEMEGFIPEEYVKKAK